MKKLRQIITEIRAGKTKTPEELNDVIWQLICYPPKMPLRLQNEQLLNEAEKFSLKVSDDYFAERTLVFNGFKWGEGKHRVLITHGWGSKAADFAELISKLREIGNLEIIAFDAPGNGRSEGELSNLLLFILSVKAIFTKFGAPDVTIGHSLGGMANIMALTEMKLRPSLVVSIAPLIRLKENFEASMRAADLSWEVQDIFLKSFEAKFKKPASYFNLNDQYGLDASINHLLIYDNDDLISPEPFIAEFLNKNPSITSRTYESVGHDRVIKSPDVINDIGAAIEIATG